MKKVFISLGIILVIAGIVIVGVYGGAKGFTDWKDFHLHDLTKADAAVEISPEESQELEKIDIIAEYFCVYVVTADVDRISVKHVSDMPDEISFSVLHEGNRLQITAGMKNKDHFPQCVWSGDVLKFFVVIELPKHDSFKDLKIESNIEHGLIYDVDGFLN